MTYNKPHNITYTQMAVWVDENCYNEDCDDLKLYEYLYHLVYMLAREGRYFNQSHYYDEFSLFGASRLFLRLKNNRQFEFDNNGNPKLKQVKSILNYIKTVIYPYKVDFEQENYCSNTEDNLIIYTDSCDLGTHLSDEADVFKRIDFSLTLDNIAFIAKSYLARIPKKKNSAEWLNIYISCLLTLINSLTLTRIDKKNYIKYGDKRPEMIDSIYKGLKNDEPVLYHLDDSYSNYIKILVNEIRHAVAKELSIELNTYVSVETTMKNIIISSLENEDD